MSEMLCIAVQLNSALMQSIVLADVTAVTCRAPLPPSPVNLALSLTHMNQALDPLTITVIQLCIQGRTVYARMMMVTYNCRSKKSNFFGNTYRVAHLKCYSSRRYV